MAILVAPPGADTSSLVDQQHRSTWKGYPPLFSDQATKAAARSSATAATAPSQETKARFKRRFEREGSKAKGSDWSELKTMALAVAKKGAPPERVGVAATWRRIAKRRVGTDLATDGSVRKRLRSSVESRRTVGVRPASSGLSADALAARARKRRQRALERETEAEPERELVKDGKREKERESGDVQPPQEVEKDEDKVEQVEQQQEEEQQQPQQQRQQRQAAKQSETEKGASRASPPLGYICRLCNVAGHYIRHCPIALEQAKAKAKAKAKTKTKAKAKAKAKKEKKIMEKKMARPTRVHEDGIERFVPPSGYLCVRCKIAGHYVNECPLIEKRNKKAETHQGPRPLCDFFLKGACLKGEACPFSHDLSREPCRFYHLHVAGECLGVGE